MSSKPWNIEKSTLTVSKLQQPILFDSFWCRFGKNPISPNLPTVLIILGIKLAVPWRSLLRVLGPQLSQMLGHVKSRCHLWENRGNTKASSFFLTGKSYGILWISMGSLTWLLPKWLVGKLDGKPKCFPWTTWQQFTVWDMGSFCSILRAP